MAINLEYKDLLKDPRWQKKRLEIFTRDDWSCRICGNEKLTLHLHHKRYLPNKKPWDYPDNFIVTLCEYCHDKHHKVDKIKQSSFSEINKMKSVKEINNTALVLISDENDDSKLLIRLITCLEYMRWVIGPLNTKENIKKRNALKKEYDDISSKIITQVY